MTIADGIGLVLSALALLASLYIAPGEAFAWLKKLFLLFLVFQIVGLFVAPLEGLKVFFIYVMNLASYRMFNEAFFAFSQQMFVLFVTWEIFLWIFGGHHTNSGQHNASGGNAGASGSQLPRAPGFTTRRL